MNTIEYDFIERLQLLKGINKINEHDDIPSPCLQLLIDEFEQYFEKQFGLENTKSNIINGTRNTRLNKTNNTSNTSNPRLNNTSNPRLNKTNNPRLNKTNNTSNTSNTNNTRPNKTNNTSNTSNTRRSNTNKPPIKSMIESTIRNTTIKKSSNNNKSLKTKKKFIDEETFKKHIEFCFGNNLELDSTKTITYHIINTEIDSATKIILEKLRSENIPTINNLSQPLPSLTKWEKGFSSKKIEKIKELWLRCTDLLKKTYEYPLQRDNAILINYSPIQIKTEMYNLIDTMDYNGEINNALICKDNDTVKNHTLTCYPDHVLIELRDAFNIHFPEKAFHDEVPEIIVKRLHYYFGNKENSFLDLIPNNRKKYLIDYFAAPLLDFPGDGSKPTQYVPLFLHYETKYPHFAFINYEFERENKKIIFHDKYISEIDRFSNLLRKCPTIEALFPEKNNIREYFHTEFIIVLYFFLQQEHITTIGIYIGYEVHARGIYIDKNTKNVMLYDGHGKINASKNGIVTKTLRSSVLHLMNIYFEKDKYTFYENEQHQFLAPLCGVFVVTMLLYMLDPTQTTQKKMEHFMFTENRDADIIKNQTIQQNNRLYELKNHSSIHIKRTTAQKDNDNKVYVDEIEKHNIYFIVNRETNICGYYMISYVNEKTIRFDGNSCDLNDLLIFKNRPTEDTIVDKDRKKNIVFIKDMKIDTRYYFINTFSKDYWYLPMFKFSRDKTYGYIKNKLSYNITNTKTAKIELSKYGFYYEIPKQEENNFVTFQNVKENVIYYVIFIENNKVSKNKDTYTIKNAEENMIILTNNVTNQSKTRSINECCFFHKYPIEIIERMYDQLLLFNYYYIYSNRQAVYGVHKFLRYNSNTNVIVFRDLCSVDSDVETDGISFDICDIFIFKIIYDDGIN